MFRPNSDGYKIFGYSVFTNVGGNFYGLGSPVGEPCSIYAGNSDVPCVDSRVTDKLGNPQGGRVVIDVLGGIDLFDEPIVHDGEFVTQCAGFGLVVGNEDGGDVVLGLNGFDFCAHLGAQLGVQT